VQHRLHPLLYKQAALPQLLLDTGHVVTLNYGVATSGATAYLNPCTSRPAGLLRNSISGVAPGGIRRYI
jgi:hypothetical protein